MSFSLFSCLINSNSQLGFDSTSPTSRAIRIRMIKHAATFTSITIHSVPSRRRFRQCIVNMLGSHVSVLIVYEPAFRQNKTFCNQMIVDSIVSCNVPFVCITFLSTCVMHKHKMHNLVRKKAFTFHVCKFFKPLDVVKQMFAINSTCGLIPLYWFLS